MKHCIRCYRPVNPGLVVCAIISGYFKGESKVETFVAKHMEGCLCNECFEKIKSGEGLKIDDTLFVSAYKQHI